MIRIHPLLLLLILLAPAPAAAVDEAAARRYALERLTVRDLRAPAAQLQAELEQEILRYIDLAERSGRPGPAYFEIGVVGSYMLWGNPGETAYVLAEALPYLSPATQARAKTFLAAMVRAADPTEVAFEHCGGWGACELRPPRREYHLLPMPPDPEPVRPNLWPAPAVPAETIYMLWRYADSTGDWDFISESRPPSGARWQRLRNLFLAIPATPSRYGEVAGAIGWVRLLEQFGLASDPTYAQALAKIRAGYAAGNPFSRFLDTANQRFIGPHHHDWSFPPFHWHRDQNAIGVFFAPEIGRFLAEYSLEDVRRRVTSNPRAGQPGEPNAIETHWPEWFLYRGEYPPTEKWTSHYGENHMTTPDVPWALFMVHAYVYNEPGDTLSRYLDVPYAVGDLCHWQRLVAAIQAHGVKEWRPLSGGPPPSNQPPSVALTAPANGATFIAPATVDLAASATDPDGTVARVEFLVNGAVAATVTAPPYAWRATFSALGAYQLAARAFDNLGASAVSATVNITVQAPPADTTPPSVPQGLTATALGPNSVRLSWQASTDNVGVAGYELERNGALLPGLIANREFTDTGLSASTAYTYRVRASDAAGNRSAWSAAATVSTPSSNGGGTPPPQVVNLLSNGGFETGNFQGWNNEWGFEVNTASAHSGRYGARMAGEGRLTQVFRTVRGRRYYVMARVRIDREITRPAWGGVRVQITAYNWTELAVHTLTLQNAPAGVWKRVDLTFVANSTQSRIAFENSSGGGRWEASGDEFYVSETPIPPDGTPPQNQPPVVAISAPANGATFVAPATVDITATATDPDGTVARVEFLINGSVTGVATAAPFTYRATLSAPGTYQLAARAVDNQGASTLSATVTITVTAPSGGGGGGIGSDTHRYSFDLIEKLNQVGSGNQQMFRWWISGHVWGSAWWGWTSRTLPYEGTVPATGLSLESAWANGLAAILLDSRNPLMFQGFSASNPGLVPGRRYRVRVRWRTEGVTGPQRPGQPFGVCLKFTGWPEPGQTGDLPVLVPHVAGDTPWHLAYADFTATADLLPNLAVILENTTAGRAFVDEIALHELAAEGSLGPQLLMSPRANAHLYFDLRRSAAIDAILEEAARLGITLRLVISEKQEYLLNHLGPDGLADRNPVNFNNGPGSANRWLHEARWRYLFARFGAWRSVHSWELVNEEAPGPTPHFLLAARLAVLAGQDGNPHPATTSTWATFAEEAWKAPASAPISNVDFHVYVRAGWIEPREELANDSARFFAEYDRASLAMRWGKPATWGEQGINGPASTDDEDPGLRNDRQGIWLHKMIWARCGPGGVYPLYWWTGNIFDYRLHGLYGNWNRFMAGIPLNNGRYTDAQAQTSNPDLRAFGQKDTAGGRAHLWIDNRRHTWRAVVDRVAVPAVSGTVTVNMGSPGAVFRATWYDTYSGSPVRSQTVTANGAGEVVLQVQNLATDTAVRLERQ